MLKHQMLILNRSRKRAPKLTPWDRLLLGLGACLLNPKRIPKIAVRFLLDQAVRGGTKSSLPDILVKKLEKLHGEKWWEALGARVNERAIADEDDVSQVGTLGFYMHPGAAPSQPMTIGSVKMESSKGNTA